VAKGEPIYKECSRCGIEQKVAPVGQGFLCWEHLAEWEQHVAHAMGDVRWQASAMDREAWQSHFRAFAPHFKDPKERKAERDGANKRKMRKSRRREKIMKMWREGCPLGVVCQRTSLSVIQVLTVLERCGAKLPFTRGLLQELVDTHRLSAQQIGGIVGLKGDSVRRVLLSWHIEPVPVDELRLRQAQGKATDWTRVCRTLAEHGLECPSKLPKSAQRMLDASNMQAMV